MIFIGNINCLKSGLNKWIKELVNALKGEKGLKKIELHGFTTRDMYPCCFQHVSDFLKQANDEQNKNTHFFGALIQRLKAEKIVNEGENIPVTFYISSLVKLGREEFNCSRYENYGNACSEEEKVKTTQTSRFTLHFFEKFNNRRIIYEKRWTRKFLRYFECKPTYI